MEDHSSYTERITLDEGDVDYRGLMRPSALLRCAEHMATAHAWELGMDKAFYSARQMVYLVGRQAFQFLRVPAVDTRWTLVDTTASKIIRHIPEDMERYWSDTVEWELPLQVPKASALTSAGLRRAAYSLCDTNRHINNAAYLDVACDALPLEVVEQGPMRYAAVKYHRQVPLGEEMELFYGPAESEDGPGWYVAGRREDKAAWRRLPLLRLFSFSAVRPAPHRRYPASCAKKSVFQGGLFCLSARAWGRRVWRGPAHGAVLRSFQIHPMQSDCFLRAEFGKVCRRKVLYSGLKCGIIIAKYLSPAPRGAQASEVSHRLA